MRLSVIALLLLFYLPGCTVGESGRTTSPDNRHNHAQSLNQTGEPDDTQRMDESISDPEPTHEIQFEREISYGSTNFVVVGKIASVAADKRNRVFIADSDQTTVHVFKSDVSYLTSLGRQGEGPGEFTAMYESRSRNLFEIESDRLYVSTGAQLFPTKVQVFALEDLSFSHTIKLTPENRSKYTELEGYYPNQMYPRDDGLFLVAYHRSQFEYKNTAESDIRYMIQDSTGNIVSGPVLELKDRIFSVYEAPNKGTRMTSFPFYGKSLLDVSAEGHLYAVNNSQEFTIDVYDANGTFIRSFEHSFTNRALTRNGLIEYYKNNANLAKLDQYEGENVGLKMIRNAENLPETWPALGTMFFDDENRIWVATIVEDLDYYEWWVLEKSGEVTGRFKWPRNKPVEAVNNGYLYVRESNEMGVSIIVRYRIDLK